MSSSLKAIPLNVDFFVTYKVKQAEKIALKNAPQSLNKGAAAFSTAAAKMMPPNTGSLKIPEKFYQRKTFSIISLFKKPKFQHLRREFAKQLAKGLRFVTFGYKDRGKHQVRIYTASRYLAKQNYGRIKYRGLYKWLWGARLNEIGEKVPAAFKKLLAASPDLMRKKSLASMKMEKTPTSRILVSEYQAQGIDYFAEKAESKALKSSVNKIKSFLKKKIDKGIKNV